MRQGRRQELGQQVVYGKQQTCCTRCLTARSPVHILVPCVHDMRERAFVRNKLTESSLIKERRSNQSWRMGLIDTSARAEEGMPWGDFTSRLTYTFRALLDAACLMPGPYGDVHLARATTIRAVRDDQSGTSGGWGPRSWLSCVGNLT